MNKSFMKYPSFVAFQQEQQKTNRYFLEVQKFEKRFLFVFHNSVYDLTEFLDRHPGGRGPLNTYKGRDLDNIFFNSAIHKHSQQAVSVLEKYKCGIIEQKQTLNQQSMLGSKSTSITQSNFTSKTPPKKVIQLNESDKKMQQKSQSVKPKPYNTEDRLNQSMSKLNQSMTSSVKSQFLLIPTQQEIINMQKQKQQKLLKQWKQSEIEELKRQQADVIRMRSEQIGFQEDRKTQSEILVSPRKKSANPYYQAWLDKQKQQQQQSEISNNILPAYLTSTAAETNQYQQSQFQSVPQQSFSQPSVGSLNESKLSHSVIVQKTQKKVNPYYEEWKRKQSLKLLEQQQESQKYEQTLSKQQSIILEESESQISGQPSSMNNSFQRSYSMSQRTIVQEDPHLQVPVFSPKFISPIKAKYVISSSMKKL